MPKERPRLQGFFEFGRRGVCAVCRGHKLLRRPAAASDGRRFCRGSLRVRRFGVSPGAAGSWVDSPLHGSGSGLSRSRSVTSVCRRCASVEPLARGHAEFAGHVGRMVLEELGDCCTVLGIGKACALGTRGPRSPEGCRDLFLRQRAGSTFRCAWVVLSVTALWGRSAFPAGLITLGCASCFDKRRVTELSVCDRSVRYCKKCVCVFFFFEDE